MPHNNNDDNDDDEEQSLISKFPSDILSLIFQYTCPTPLFDGRYHCPDTNSLRSLSLVSRHWHQTLMGTSELWTNIIIPMEGDDTRPYATTLASFFEKTRYRGLSLSLNFSGLSSLEDCSDGDGDTVLLHPCVDAAILENLERVENLQLVKPPRAWFSHFRFLTRVDHLSLYGVHVGNHDHPLYLDRLPSLSKFTLVNANIRLTTTTTTGCFVTALTLINVPLHTCFHIFTHCPQLTHLHVEDYDSPDSRLSLFDDDLPPPSEAFPPRHLHTLTWKLFNTIQNYTTTTTPWQTALLTHINPSSLHTLAWHQPPSWILRSSPPGHQLCSAISHFYANLSTKLTCLEFIENIEDVWRNESRFVKQLRNGSGIERVGFEGCTVPFIMAVFRKIVRVRDREWFKGLGMVRMGRIVWSNPRNEGLDERFGRMLAESFLDLVRVRVGEEEVEEEEEGERPRRDGGGGMVLWLEDDEVYREKEGSNCGWVDYVKEEVVEMKRAGCRIEIFIASKPVSWL